MKSAERDIVVLGAGGHAKVLIDMLRASGRSIRAILDPDPAKHGHTVLGVTVKGSESLLAEWKVSEIHLVNGLGSVKSTEARRHLFESWKARGYEFATVVHPSAVVAAEVTLEEGVQLFAGTVIQPGTVVGANTIVNTRASVDHDCRIGPHVQIAPGCTLSGGIVVEEDVHIGTGASVIQGVHVGRGAVIGAGAVVIRDVPASTIVAGVPARQLRCAAPA